MCGIFGFLGKTEDAGNFILNSLRSLEYRGYDSWGLALKKNDGSLLIERQIGKIKDYKLPKIDSSIGLGHTRWATHGGVTIKNAHPHTDCSKKIIVVHNGIVENFNDLKNKLINAGHKFTSNTDTEVIAHLFEELNKSEKDRQLLIKKLKAMINGLNAIVILLPEENTFYIIKNGSPIVIGEKDNYYLFASDSSALSPFTKKVYYMEDNEALIISKIGYKLRNMHGKDKKIKFQSLTYASKSAAKGKYPHFMLKEISEQPDILKKIAHTQIKEIKKAADLIKSSYGTYLIGCGTASYACLAGTYLFSKIAKRHINFSIGSEFSYLIDFLKNDSLVFALSQSGETIDVISSLKKAKQKKAKLLSLTNSYGSTIYRMSQYNCLLNAGIEKAVASTKTYTAKIAYLYLIAHSLANSFDKGVNDILEAAKEVNCILLNKNKIKDLASKIKNKSSIFILGRGISYAAALESALKIKEVSYIHAEGFAAGELKHGVIALISRQTPVIVFNPEDETYSDTLSAAFEIKARGGYVIGISSKNNPVFDTFIKVKNSSDATIIQNVVIAQLLGYYLALEKKLDPDKPRNLAKSVTVK